MSSKAKDAIQELLRSVKYMIDTALNKTTKVYSGIVVSTASNGRYNIRYNGEVHPVRPYGEAVPLINQSVEVIIPQGNQALAWFFINESSGGSGGDGTTFIPSVSEAGAISWTNDGGLPNPTPVNIKGPKGDEGDQGPQGLQGNKGDTGPYYIPSVSTEGVISWTNNGNLTNPTEVNIKGPQGIQGIQGEQGIQGIQGEKGDTGSQGPKGDTGPYFMPSVSDSGELSWTNNGGLENPATANIKGPQGEQGPKGDTGATGADGSSATITVGTTTTGEAGSSAQVTNTGTESAAVLNFTIPKGDKGETGDAGSAATIAVGTVTTGDPGTNAQVTNSGTESAAVFDFVIPRGADGSGGTSGVSSFNSRTGDVVPQSGDYTAEMVEALALTGGNLTGDVHTTGDFYIDNNGSLTVKNIVLQDATTGVNGRLRMNSNGNIAISNLNGDANFTVKEGNYFSVDSVDDSQTVYTNLFRARAGNIRLNTDTQITGRLDMNSQRIENLATPVSNSDAATKKYVDSNDEYKQNKLTGSQGQFVGFDATGSAVAQNLGWDSITNLLWENPSPTSAFTAQTITIPTLHEYEAIILQYLEFGNYNLYGTKLIFKNSPVLLFTILGTSGYGSGGPWFGQRKVTWTEKGIEVLNDYYCNLTTTTWSLYSSHLQLIPVKIYGIA